MELSRTIASLAVVLAALLVIGYARGEGSDGEPAKETAQQKLEKREQARREAVIEQQRRAELFDRNCRKPVKTAEEMAVCRAVYRQM